MSGKLFQGATVQAINSFLALRNTPQRQECCVLIASTRKINSVRQESEEMYVRCVLSCA